MPPCMYHARMVCKVNFALIFLVLSLINPIRCMARANHLDDDIPRSRTREHTNLLVEELELGVLWDEYGIVGDIVVSILSTQFFFISPFVFCYSTSTPHHEIANGMEGSVSQRAFLLFEYLPYFAF